MDPGTCRPRRALVAALLSLAVASCGGGGGAASNGSGTGSSGLSYSLSQTSVTATQDTSSPTAQAVTINFVVHAWSQRPPTDMVVPVVTMSGVPIENVSTTFGPITPAPADPDTGTGSITITLWVAHVLGAGVYTGDVTLSLCFTTNAAICGQMSAGGPTTIPVTLTVTGAQKPTTSAQLSDSGLVVEIPSTATSVPSTSFLAFLSETAPTPFVSVTQPSGGFVSGVQLVPGAASGGTLTVSFVSPQGLAIGTHTETLQINFCIDAQCQHPLLDSPVSIPVTYTVLATQGTDYQVLNTGVLANDIGFVDSTQKLYAVISQHSATSPGVFAEIDPRSGTVTRSVAIGGEPAVLALSDDGSYAYIGFQDQSVVQRIAIATFTGDVTIPLGTDPIEGPIYAGYLAVPPGEPQSVAVSTYGTQGTAALDSLGVFVFDGATLRPAAFGQAAVPRQQVQSLAWGSDSATLYALDPSLMNLYQLSATATGLIQVADLQGVPLHGRMQYVGGLLYQQAGISVDPLTGTLVGRLLPATVTFTASVTAVVSGLNRSYMFYNEQLNSGPAWTLAVFDMNQNTLLGASRTSGFTLAPGTLNGNGGRLVRLGGNGLALSAAEGLQLITGSFVNL